MLESSLKSCKKFVLKLNNKLSWIILIIAIYITQIAPSYSGPDSYYYLRIAHSLIHDKDIMLVNEWAEYSKKIVPTFSITTGHVIEVHQIGTSLFWMPFLYLGTIVPFLGTTFSLLCINSLDFLLGILILIFSFKIATNLCTKSATVATIVTFTLGTSFFYYITLLSGGALILPIFLATVFVYEWMGTRGNRSLSEWALLGLLAGIMLMVRREFIFYCLLPLFDIVKLTIKKEFKQMFVNLLLFIGLAFFAFLPQFIAWKTIYGTLFMPPHKAFDRGGMYAHLVLFSSYHGLFFYAPILLFFCYGFFFLWKKQKELSIVALVGFTSITYVTGSWRYAWWAGGSFGQRFFLPMTPLWILIGAAFLEKIPLLWRWIISVICCIWTFLLFQAVGAYTLYINTTEIMKKVISILPVS